MFKLEIKVFFCRFNFGAVTHVGGGWGGGRCVLKERVQQMEEGVGRGDGWEGVVCARPFFFYLPLSRLFSTTKGIDVVVA